jgi:hypothetical protein
MIIRTSEGSTPNAVSGFCRQVIDGLPLAEAALSLWSFVMEPEFLVRVFEEHRGRSFSDVVTFPVFVELMADALLHRQGSGRQAFSRAREHNALPACVEAVYGKLRRVPLTLSQGFFEQTTERLRAIRPDEMIAHTMPSSLDEFTIVIVDGKILKNVAKRLMVSRGKAGKLYGGRLLVAYVPAEGLARSFVADPDGETNDAKLIPALIPAARKIIAGPRLWVLDRQFCDLTQPRVLADDGDHYVIRFHPKNSFELDESRVVKESKDAAGRTVFEEWGWLGGETSKRRLSVRRIRLQRSGEEEIILVTDLLDDTAYPTLDLLAVYLERWGIERVFQQITEVFNLKRLIGSTPQATIFQAAFCLLLYNVLQVLRQHVAAAQSQPCRPETLSTEQIYTDLERQLIAVTELVPSAVIAAIIPKKRTESQLKTHLRDLLTFPLPKLWNKTKNSKPRSHAKKKKGSGAHTSVARLIEADKKLKAP